MSISIKVPAFITQGVAFTLQVAANPAGDFEVTVFGGGKNLQFGLKRGTVLMLPQASSQVISVDGAANWKVELDIPDGVDDYTIKLVEVAGGTREVEDSGKVG